MVWAWLLSLHVCCQLTALEVAEDELAAMALAYLLGNVTPRYVIYVLL